MGKHITGQFGTAGTTGSRRAMHDLARAGTRQRFAPGLTPVAAGLALLAMTGGWSASVHAQQAMSGAWFASGGASAQNRATVRAMPGGGVPASVRQQQQARQRLDRSVANLGRTAAAIAAQQGAQAAARAAAHARATGQTVPDAPNGLVAGGLWDKDAAGNLLAWAGAERATQAVGEGKHVVAVKQTAARAVLNWDTFNIGRDTTLNFEQTSTDAVLNRVVGADTRPSQIQGAIKAAGTVMVVNQNGVVFSGTSQVNVRNLVAAAGKITDAQFQTHGLYSADTTPSIGEALGRVEVQAGARLATHAPSTATQGGGYVLLAGREVVNAGHITTPAGQALLAAGDSFIIRKGASTDGNATSSTRGNEVTPVFNAASLVAGEMFVDPAGTMLAPGKVSNTGLIVAETGDITLAGHDVVQAGVAVATTSVYTRGTIHLTTPLKNTSEKVTLVPGSITAVVLDASTTTALDGQRDAIGAMPAQGNVIPDATTVQIRSGGGVLFEGDRVTTRGSLLVATGGVVDVQANGRTLLESGSEIDVSGAVGVVVAMAANNLNINVQGNEQRDAPINRDSKTLNNSDVWIDRRTLVRVAPGGGYATERWYTGGGLLEVSGYLAGSGRTIGEWMAQGGLVRASGADLVTRKGSHINLSGGTLDVQDGLMKQTWLRGDDGRLYELASAPGDVLYSGVYRGYEALHTRWGDTATRSFYNPLIAPSSRFETGYTVGRDAGTLVVATDSAVLEGELISEVYQGERQVQARQAGLDGYYQSQNAVARRGQLVVGRYEAFFDPVTRRVEHALSTQARRVTLAPSMNATADDMQLELPVPEDRKGLIVLDAQRINHDRLGALALATTEGVDVDAALMLAPGANVTLLTPVVNVNANITASGGEMVLGNIAPQFILASRDYQDRVVLLPEVRSSVSVAAGVVLDVSGTWTNRLNDPTGSSLLPYMNGGRIQIRSTGDVLLAEGSLIDAGSGAALAADGAQQGGRGGDVFLSANDQGSDALGRLVLDGAMVGSGVRGGGTLTLQAGHVVIGSARPGEDAITSIDPTVFQTGFGTFDVVGIDSLTIADRARVDVQSPVYRLRQDARATGTQAHAGVALERWVPPLYDEQRVDARLAQRAGADISLRAGGLLTSLVDVEKNTFHMGEDARIVVDPGHSITIRGPGQITLLGQLQAAGGRIDVRQQQFGAINIGDDVVQAQPTEHQRSIWVGDRAVLDVAGRAAVATDSLGRAYGQVLAGGSIVLGGEIDVTQARAHSADAFVVVRPGAVLDASGAQADLHVPGQGLTRIASDGGSIALSSYNGLFLDGTLRAHAGGTGAAGGRLQIALDTPSYSEITATNGVRHVREMIVSQRGGPTLGSDVSLPAGQSVDGPALAPDDWTAQMTYGRVDLSADRMMAGGFGTIDLLSHGLLSFDGDVRLSAAQRIALIAPGIGLSQTSTDNAQISLNAQQVVLSGLGAYAAQPPAFRPRIAHSAVAPNSSARFDVQADLIDVRNSLSFGMESTIRQMNDISLPVLRRGFDAVALRSAGDIRFLENLDNDASTRLWTGGNLLLAAAQVYPSTGASAVVYAGYYRDPIANRQVFDPTRRLTISGVHEPQDAGDAKDANVGTTVVLPAQPYSVFGTLQLGAAQLHQGGVVRAPLGRIVLGGTTGVNADSLVLLPGSVTSVSAAGLVMPYGGTTDGVNYLYDGTAISLFGPGSTSASGITLGAVKVDVREQALLDLAGGGELLGAGFVSGRGGSVDARFHPLMQQVAGGGFALPGLTTNPVYAIVPGVQAPQAPVSGQGASEPLVGQQVTIGAGVPGLAVGVYTLMPSTYALMPGAFRVEINGAGQGGATTGAVALRNGSWSIAGNLKVPRAGVDSAVAQPLIVTSADMLRRYSQYDETGYSAFARADAIRKGVPRAALPEDGKTLRLELAKGVAGDIGLAFAGLARFDAARDGYRGAAVLDGATTFEILADAVNATEGFDGVSVRASTLNALNAGRLSIGGAPVASYGQSGRLVGFSGDAYGVVLRSGAVLSAPEVFLFNASASGAGITVEPGAAINTLGRGAPSFDSRHGYVYVPYSLNASNPSAGTLLAVSNGLLDIGATAPAGSSVAGPLSIGVCTVGVCVNPTQLYSDGTIAMSTGSRFALDESVSYGTRNLALSVGGILIGSTQTLADLAARDALAPGLILNQTLLDRLLRGDPQQGAPALENLILTARDAVSFYGSVSLDTRDPVTGKTSLTNLVLGTPAIYGYGNADDVATLRTGSLIWRGSAQPPGAVTAGGAGTGSGRLLIEADRIELGAASNAAVSGVVPEARLALGFDRVDMVARDRFTSRHDSSLSVYRAQGAFEAGSGFTYSGGNLSILTPLMTGEAGSISRIVAGGQLTATVLPGSSGTPVAIEALGAELRLSGATVLLDTTIMLPSGKLVVQAQNDLNLGATSRIDVAGRKVVFDDVTKYSWGGDVALESLTGNVAQATGAVIDLSAAFNRAGTLDVTALNATGGGVTLQGNITGTSSGYYDAGGTYVPYKAASVSVRAQHLGQSGALDAEFAALNQQLNAGGVTGARSFQFKQGSLVIGDELKAGEVAVSIDHGSLTVAGRIDASGERVGSIRLAARDGLTLGAQSVLDAHGTVLRVDSYGRIIDAPNRAVVELNGGQGLLVLASGARIDLRHGTTEAVGARPGQHDGRARGTLDLYAARVDEAGRSDTQAALTYGDVAIDARGPQDIVGARSIAVNAVARYADAPLGNDPLVSGKSYQYIDQHYLDLKHDDSTAFMTQALTRPALLGEKLAGLNSTAYADAYHLRPAIEIVTDSATNPDGGLVVVGDLDLSKYRYASVNPRFRKTSVYGSGEVGTLIVRAAGDLDIFGSVNDGFAPPPQTTDDSGWLLMPGTQPFGADVILPNAGVTLADGTTFSSGATLNYDVPIKASMLAVGTRLPVAATLASDYSLAAGTVVGAAIHDAQGNLLYAAGSVLGDATLLPAGTRLGAGTVLARAVSLAAMTWPKGVPLPNVVIEGGPAWEQNLVLLDGDLALRRGSRIPSMTKVLLPTGVDYVELRPSIDGVQGRNWALASMLPAGSQSWAQRWVAGADLDAADTRVVQSSLASGGLRLADTHYGLNLVVTEVRPIWSDDNGWGGAPGTPISVDDEWLCDIYADWCVTPARYTWSEESGMGTGQPIPEDMVFYCEFLPTWCVENVAGTSVNVRSQNFSVLRTGTGDLDLRAAGDLTLSSAYGVYTAGTQAAGIDNNSPYNLARGKLGGTVLGESGAGQEALAQTIVDGGLYGAWYPEAGGNLNVLAGGNIAGDVLGERGFMNGAKIPVQSASVNVGNWLWRQGTGSADPAGNPTAWWINFGSYVNDPVDAPTSPDAPVIVGFTGFGTLGGGNVSLTAGGHAGNREVRGDTGLPTTVANPRSQGLIVAVGSTGRVSADGTLVLTGGGDMDVVIGSGVNPSLQARAQNMGNFGAGEFFAAPLNDLQGALINLRGASSLVAGRLGGINLQYQAGLKDTRALDPLAASSASANGGLALIPGDSTMRVDTRGDLVVGGAADPGRVRLRNSTGFTDARGVEQSGGGLSWFSLWTSHTAIDLFAAGGNLTPSTQVADAARNSATLPVGQNTSATDGHFIYPSILRATAPGGSVYVGPAASFDGARSVDTFGSYSILLAPSATGELSILAGDSIYGGGYTLSQSGADPASLPSPLRPAFIGYTGNNRGTPVLSNGSLAGNARTETSGNPLFFFRPNTSAAADIPTTPARFYAMRGDIVGLASGEITTFGEQFGARHIGQTWYEAGRPVWMKAGRDIVASGNPLGAPTQLVNGEDGYGGRASGNLVSINGNLFVHGHANDVSQVSAGRDILYSSFNVAGPGTLEIAAGRHIVMDDRASIRSLGGVIAGDSRPGAAVAILAGVGAAGPDYIGFAQRYLNPANRIDAGQPLADQPGRVVQSHELMLAQWLSERYGFGLTDGVDAVTQASLDGGAAARAFFDALPPEQQRIFSREIYFAELRAGGREYTDVNHVRYGSYLRGREAIAALFPAAVDGQPRVYGGDLTMFGASGINTLFGGDIQILTPGGRQVFGTEGEAPVARAGVVPGVVTQGEGDIQLYSAGSILLGQSRIMTTFGGGIVAWSAQGDINAGRGAKTSVLYTPPKRVYDTVGNVTVSSNVPSTGAGIATLSPIAEVPAGDIDLIAPLGTIDAGEAGIRVSGNINLAALQVVNAANVQVQGDSVGMPPAASVNVGALISASTAAASAAGAAQDTVQRARADARRDLPSIINVQILGFGDATGATEGGAHPASRSGANAGQARQDSVEVLGQTRLSPQQLAKLTDTERKNLMR